MYQAIAYDLLGTAPWHQSVTTAELPAYERFALFSLANFGGFSLRPVYLFILVS